MVWLEIVIRTIIDWLLEIPLDLLGRKIERSLDQAADRQRRQGGTARHRKARRSSRKRQNRAISNAWSSRPTWMIHILFSPYQQLNAMARRISLIFKATNCGYSTSSSGATEHLTQIWTPPLNDVAC